MLTHLFTTTVLKLLDDEKLDDFAEKVAEKVAIKVLDAILADLKKHLGQ